MLGDHAFLGSCINTDLCKLWFLDLAIQDAKRKAAVQYILCDPLNSRIHLPSEGHCILGGGGVRFSDLAIRAKR